MKQLQLFNVICDLCECLGNPQKYNINLYILSQVKSEAIVETFSVL